MANPQIQLKTNLGTIDIELFESEAPKTVANFLSYVDQGFYEGLIFHRVIPGFMVQGGGFDENMDQKSGQNPIQNEANNGVSNDRGTIAMARTSDPHSASSQFFINLVDNTNLNHTSESPQGWGYCAFGKVTDGMDVVDTIAEAATGNHGMHQNVPMDTIIIESASRLA